MSTAPATRPATILIVEDEEPLLEVLAQVLTDAGYQVETALDGKIATQRLKARHFDLVLTDLVMPEKDGLGMILEMRKTNQSTPVIALSAYGENTAGNYLKIAKALGARAILEKPCTNERLLATVRSVLGTRLVQTGGPSDKRSSWSVVKVGMAKAEILELLGDPINVTQGNWIYPDGGSISFDAGDRVSAIYAL